MLELLLVGGILLPVTPVGQQLWTATTGNFTIPTGVTSICAVCVGSGGGRYASQTTVGGSGGDLRWRNNITVTPGETLTITAGTQTSAGSVSISSKIIRASTGEVLLIAKGGNNTDTSSTIAGDIGGGNGGFNTSSRGGGGAGGYSGNGGYGAGNINTSAGAGGAAGAGCPFTNNGTLYGGSGGGVGVLGQGTSGAGKVDSGANNASSAVGFSGSGGSSGTAQSNTVSTGGLYGGGGGGTSACSGGAGAVRIIWGAGRAFPSTKTADQTPVTVASSAKITKIVSAGSSGNEALGVMLADGNFYTRGRATSGKLGNGSTTADNFSSWYKAASNVIDCWGGGNTFLLKKSTGYTTFGSGTPFGLTSDNLTETTLPSSITNGIDMSTVTNICMSVESALFLGGSSGNTVYGTGTNTNGSLGTATTNITSPMTVSVNIKAISMSAATSYLIDTDGHLFTSGDNTYNQLGDGTTTTRKSLVELLVNSQSGIVSSVVAGLTGAHILTTDGSVYGVGAYIYGQGSARLTSPTLVTLPASTNGYSLTLPSLGNTASVVNNGDKTAYYGRSSLGSYYGLAANTSDAYVAFGTSFDHTKTAGFIQLSNSSWFLNDGKLYHAGNQTITDTYDSTNVDATYTQVGGP